MRDPLGHAIDVDRAREAGAARATTSSSRSTTRSRRTRSRCCARRWRKWQREGRDRDRARSDDGRACSRWRRSPGYNANSVPASARGGPAGEPRRHRRVRARLGVQGRDDRGRAVGRARHAADEVHAARTRSASPTASSTTPSSRPTETMTVAQILQRSSNVGAVTIARRSSAQTRLQTWIPRFGFGQPTGHRLPGRERRVVLPLVLVGLDDRQRPDRPGHLGDADPARVGVRGDRERRRLGPAASRRPRPGRAAAAADARGGSSRRTSTASC